MDTLGAELAQELSSLHRLFDQVLAGQNITAKDSQLQLSSSTALLNLPAVRNSLTALRGGAVAVLLEMRTLRQGQLSPSPRLSRALAHLSPPLCLPLSRSLLCRCISPLSQGGQEPTGRQHA